MGQTIVVEDRTVVGDVVMFDTDRTLTGQDGRAYSSLEEARESDEFPGTLAVRLFEAGLGANHVFVASNQVVVRRTGGWSEEQVDSAAQVISDLFRFYPGS